MTTSKKLDAAFQDRFTISLTAFARTIGMERPKLVAHIKAGNLRIISNGKHIRLTRDMANSFIANGGMAVGAQLGTGE